MTTWAAAAERAGGGLRDLTVRNIVRTSAGGTGLRVRLTNAFGDRPVTFGHVYVGVPASGAALVPGSNRMLTFGGIPEVTLAPGTTALSDPLPGHVAPRQRLAVSLHLQGDGGTLTGRNRATAPPYPPDTAPGSDATTSHPPRPTIAPDAAAHPPRPTAAPNTAAHPPPPTAAPDTAAHPPRPGTTSRRDAASPAYRSLPGDHAADESGAPYTERVAVWHWLDAVIVTAPGPVPAVAVAVLGDSITTGVGSETGHGWTDLLADRAVRGPWPLAVVNEGVSGGRVLAAGTGRPAEERLTAEVLTKPGIGAVILLAGVNDLGAGARADALIGAYRRIVAKAHAAGVRVIGGTLGPFAGAEYHTPEGELARAAVNAFVRDGGVFDGLANFDAALRDPADPSRLLPRYDSGDHLHPSAAGHQAMAAALELAQLIGPDQTAAADRSPVP
ncbi:GDSL-type esterase/lipase family protein [Nonomuraea sp. NPDC049400]|uniref:GDSL-type esterase/lipase family protein n=1 Tax=Nonomuraea sp. NPDC049400 TaxID=3364352 RepID=UPI0037A3532D